MANLEFKNCPPPGSIVWENRRVGIKSRTKQILRWVVFVLIIFGMLVFSNYAQLFVRNRMELITIRYGYAPQCNEINNVFQTATSNSTENLTLYQEWA